MFEVIRDESRPVQFDETLYRSGYRIIKICAGELEA